MTTFVNVTYDLCLCVEEIAYFHKYVHVDLNIDSDILKQMSGREGHNTHIHFKDGSGLWTAATVKEVRDALATGIRKPPRTEVENAARKLIQSLKLVGEHSNWSDREETDRVFAWYEFNDLREALGEDIARDYLLWGDPGA